MAEQIFLKGTRDKRFLCFPFTHPVGLTLQTFTYVSVPNEVGLLTWGVFFNNCNCIYIGIQVKCVSRNVLTVP